MSTTLPSPTLRDVIGLDNWPGRPWPANRSWSSASPPDGTVLPAATLQTAALTTITDLFGTVVPTADALRD
ncbi:hypothetical protein AMK26_29080 [Streptomyces sp. CB03234]|uniref:hypothetical protein n=1 Tax=Streptomyces sp. (strain CB03234) TaxID=1703937 RepID=UPI000939C699|nr:hypothetical protein [Streptomyces sp. CB03234]OKJ96897.1 hypothetical protein AMK26_29080 [Streptomyces sp. CB03234]